MANSSDCGDVLMERSISTAGERMHKLREAAKKHFSKLMVRQWRRQRSRTSTLAGKESVMNGKGVEVL